MDILFQMTLIFSFFYVKHLWCQNERDKCSAGTSTLGMTVALLAALLLPVDVFLVSYMKNPDGTFKVSEKNVINYYIY